MIVKQLIEKLKLLPENAQVFLRVDSITSGIGKIWHIGAQDKKPYDVFDYIWEAKKADMDEKIVLIEEDGSK